jgi:hypothetical protein
MGGMNEIEKKEKLLKRLRSLWTWELFDSLFLPAIAVGWAAVLEQPVGLVTIYGAGLAAWLLWQGVAYWRAKLRAVETDSEVDSRLLHRLRVLKTVNWVLIGALPVLVGIEALSGDVFRSVWDAVAGLGLYTLAVLEQVNYYYYQLMYDYGPDRRWLVEQKRLKRSSLSRALDRLRDKERVSV